MTDFGLNLKGGDVSLIINTFMDTLQEFIRTYLLKELEGTTLNAL